MDSNNYPQYSTYDCVLAVDAFTSIKQILKTFESKTISTNHKRLGFGYLSYDLKNDVEPLQSSNFDGLEFPDLFF
jgi:para-aminobenzoate synthetase component 1